MKAAVVILGLILAVIGVESNFSPNYKFSPKPHDTYTIVKIAGGKGLCGYKPAFVCDVTCGDPSCRPKAKEKCGDKFCERDSICYEGKCIKFECKDGLKCILINKVVCNKVCKPEKVCKNVVVNVCSSHGRGLKNYVYKPKSCSVTKTICEVVEVCKDVCKNVLALFCTERKCDDEDKLVPCGKGFCLPGDMCIAPICQKECVLIKKQFCW